jgi:hypothetical protein
MLTDISSDRSGHELAVRPRHVAGRRHREGQMGQKLFSVSVAALILACVAGWAISDTQARVPAPATVQIDPFAAMTSATQLPTEHFADFSFVFN